VPRGYAVVLGESLGTFNSDGCPDVGGPVETLGAKAVFQAGHRIGLVVVSTDHDYTIRPLPGTRLTLDPDRSRLTLPIVGGLRL
jgi:X-Pro dipeptidyl-peptidase C-terminal non-catalytic domain/X-Pro dipeptidyl-peptidase (S15 family)